LVAGNESEKATTPSSPSSAPPVAGVREVTPAAGGGTVTALGAIALL